MWKKIVRLSVFAGGMAALALLGIAEGAAQEAPEPGPEDAHEADPDEDCSWAGGCDEDPPPIFIDPIDGDQRCPIEGPKEQPNRLKDRRSDGIKKDLC